jgi:sec-independent protein translocase protein TatC
MTQAPAEETFISHLVELRDRLVRAAIGVAIICAGLFAWPGPATIYNSWPHRCWPPCRRAP